MFSRAHPGRRGLTAPLSGQRIDCTTRAGRVSYFVAGEGPPLLLIHSVNAAASCAEVRPLYEHFRAWRTVYALDLPGFGLSERSDHPYTIELMTSAVHAIVEQACLHSHAPVDALALSLSSEFLARCANLAPDNFRTLAFVSPTGLDDRRARYETRLRPLAKPRTYRFLRSSGLGVLLYRALTRPASIRYFLRRTWGSSAIDERLWRYDVLTARQPGAAYAPLYFLTGHLFSADALELYLKLRLPVWMSHGVRGDFTNYNLRPLLDQHRNWSFDVFETGALPHFEALASFVDRYEAFLEQSARAGTHSSRY
jgi:pimeloyl-ACP methyl ester carboxylesterase